MFLRFDGHWNANFAVSLFVYAMPKKRFTECFVANEGLLQIIVSFWFYEICETKHSRVNQVKFAEDSILKIWSDMICLSRPYHVKFFKDCLPQILLGSFLNTLSYTVFLLVSFWQIKFDQLVLTIQNVILNILNTNLPWLLDPCWLRTVFLL